MPHLEEGDQEFLDAHVLEAALASALERRTGRHSDDDCSIYRPVSPREQIRVRTHRPRVGTRRDSPSSGLFLRSLLLPPEVPRIESMVEEMRPDIVCSLGSRSWGGRRRGSETSERVGLMDGRPNVFRPSGAGSCSSNCRSSTRSIEVAGGLLSRGPRQPAHPNLTSSPTGSPGIL